MKLSVCMIVRNEKAFLARALNSVADFADEIIVVDTGSTDNTIEIAQSAGAKVFTYPWSGSFADARNESLRHAGGEWILVLDADEYIAPGGEELIQQMMRIGPIGFELKIRNYLDDGNDAMEHTLLRLFPNQPYHRYQGRIHEQLVSLRPDRPLEHQACPYVVIIHDGYRSDVIQAQNKQARNQELLALAVAEDPENAFCYFNLAQNQQNGGDNKAALSSLERCIDLAPDGAAYLESAWIHAIGLTAEIESPQQAWDLANCAPEACLRNPDYWINRAGTMMGLARFHESIASYEKAASFKYEDLGVGKVDLASFTWKPYLGIAQIYILLGYPECAVIYLRKALSFSPNPLAQKQLNEIESRAPWLASV